MSKRIKKAQIKQGRIPVPEAPGSTDHMHPVFRFRHAVEGGEYSIHGCAGGDDLVALVDCFKKMEQRTWQQIKATGGKKDKSGLGFTSLDRNQLPGKAANLDEDVRDRVFEVRVTRTTRLMCFRDANACNVVWYDANHEMTA